MTAPPNRLAPKATWLLVTGVQDQVPQLSPCSYASTPHRLEAIRTQGLYLRQHLKLASSPKSNGQQVVDHRGALQTDEAVAPVLGDPAEHGIPVGLEAAQRREADGEPARAPSLHCREAISASCPHSRVWRPGRGWMGKGSVTSGYLFRLPRAPQHTVVRGVLQTGGAWRCDPVGHVSQLAGRWREIEEPVSAKRGDCSRAQVRCGHGTNSRSPSRPGPAAPHSQALLCCQLLGGR